MEYSQLVEQLFEIGAIKFGSFTLKSGITSPFYVDFRVIISDPKLLVALSKLLLKAAEDAGLTFDCICGVPYTALPLATLMSVERSLPMLMRRKEAKAYGTKNLIEGHFKSGDICLIAEDVVTSGSSVLETVEVLVAECSGLKVTDAVVLLDREQGGKEWLQAHGIGLHSVLKLSSVLSTLLASNRIDQNMFQKVVEFISQNQFSANTLKPTIKTAPAQALKYSDRANIAKHPLAKQLFTIMDLKQTNLAFAADVSQSSELLQLADEVGPYICVLKTHVDILKDFTENTAVQLQQLAKRHQFLIFEDRKFADIGETVREQFGGGIYAISNWCDFVTVHSLPGPGIISGLHQVNPEKGCVLIAEMSSAENLISADYVKRSMKMASEYREFVIGFVCQSQISDDPSFIYFTPGVHLDEVGDSLGQQYNTPEDAIMRRRSDVIIVGRGIRRASNPSEAARKYRDAGYAAYNQLFQ